MFQYIVDAIGDLFNAITSDSSSSSSSSSSSDYEREARRREREARRNVAKKEAALEFKGFFEKHGISMTNTEIANLVEACASSSVIPPGNRASERYLENETIAAIDTQTAAIESEILSLDLAQLQLRASMLRRAAMQIPDPATNL